MNALTLKTALTATLLTAGMALFSADTAEAGHFGSYRPVAHIDDHGFDHGYGPSCHRPPRCRYKTVIDFEYRTVEYVDYVTRYLPCGHPYEVEVIRTRTVKIPVERTVKICY